MHGYWSTQPLINPRFARWVCRGTGVISRPKFGGRGEGSTGNQGHKPEGNPTVCTSSSGTVN